MDELSRTALVSSQVACALIELEAMKAANVECEIKGLFQRYGADAMRMIIDRYCIDYNSVIKTLRGE